jgi:hypothetical protein
VEVTDPFLTEAGLTVVEQYGDWDRRPLSESSPEIITVAESTGARGRRRS